jgi:hypothetical protein
MQRGRQASGEEHREADGVYPAGGGGEDTSRRALAPPTSDKATQGSPHAQCSRRTRPPRLRRGTAPPIPRCAMDCPAALRRRPCRRPRPPRWPARADWIQPSAPERSARAARTDHRTPAHVVAPLPRCALAMRPLSGSFTLLHGHAQGCVAIPRVAIAEKLDWGGVTNSPPVPSHPRRGSFPRLVCVGGAVAALLGFTEFLTWRRAVKPGVTWTRDVGVAPKTFIWMYSPSAN